MAIQTFALTAARIAKYKGQILSHATPRECLAKTGEHITMPKNNSDTYIARRWLPYGGTSTDANTINRFFANGTGDRGNAMVVANQIAEGVTPTPDSIQPQDVTVVINQYGCLYGFTDKTFNLYEDDIPEQMIKQVGERVALVKEMIIYGALRGCTNVYYGGQGTTIATVNGGLTLRLLQRITRNLQANHAKEITRVLKASQDYGTEPVSSGYIVYCHTSLEQDIRALPGFTPTEKYANGKPMENEVGKCERYRFITSPDLPELQDAGASVTGTGLLSTSAVSIDVYPLIVVADEAYSHIGVRGLNSLDPTFLPPGEKSKSDPLGQRGYAGTTFWTAVMVQNHGWMALAYVGVTSLT